MKTSFKSSILAAASLMMLASCSMLVTPKTSAQAVYEIEGEYSAALSIETSYDSLQTCGTAGAPILCKNLSTAKLVRQVDDAAWVAISAAQKAVRTPGFGTDKITTAVATATNAVAAFTNIAATLGVK